MVIIAGIFWALLCQPPDDHHLNHHLTWSSHLSATMLLLGLFSRWRNWSKERFSTLPVNKSRNLRMRVLSWQSAQRLSMSRWYLLLPLPQQPLGYIAFQSRYRLVSCFWENKWIFSMWTFLPCHPCVKTEQSQTVLKVVNADFIQGPLH